MSIRIDVNNDGVEAIEDIWLGDDGPFTFTPGKSAPLMSVAMFTGSVQEREMMATRAQVKWLENGFPPEDWTYLVARIEDNNDVLDWPHLFSLAEQLMETSTGRPTTSSRGSSATRRRNTGAARPKPSESTSENSPPADSAT